MNILKMTSIAAITLAAGIAQAQVIRITVPDDVPLPVSTVTRAETIADAIMWRLAGLQDLNRGEETPDTESLEYRRAEAKYEWLRASPQFATLVKRLQVQPNATVVAGK